MIWQQDTVKYDGALSTGDRVKTVVQASPAIAVDGGTTAGRFAFAKVAYLEDAPQQGGGEGGNACF